MYLKYSYVLLLKVLKPPLVSIYLSMAQILTFHKCPSLRQKFSVKLTEVKINQLLPEMHFLAVSKRLSELK